MKHAKNPRAHWSPSPYTHVTHNIHSPQSSSPHLDTHAGLWTVSHILLLTPTTHTHICSTGSRPLPDMTEHHRSTKMPLPWSSILINHLSQLVKAEVVQNSHLEMFLGEMLFLLLDSPPMTLVCLLNQKQVLAGLAIPGDLKRKIFSLLC